jgi:DNA-binding IclR family transcriptional regulator
MVDTAPSTTSRVAEVLMSFTDATTPLGVSQIARSCDLSKAVVHRILQSLVASGLVDYLPDTRRYSLGLAAIALGQTAAAGSRLYAAGMPAISHLANQTGETTTLTARRGHGRHYIGLVESINPIRITVRMKDDVPLWSGASGISILAFMDPVDIDYVLSQERHAYTEATVIDEAMLRDRLAETRERGWAHTAGERVRMSSSVAAPVFDRDGSPAGSLSVAYLVDRLGDTQHHDLAQLVLAAARNATARMQGS